MVAVMMLGGCSGEPAGNVIAPTPTTVLKPTPAPSPTDPYSPAAAEAVARRFVTRAVAGNATAARADWRGDPGAGREAVAILARHGSAPIVIGPATDPDAGAGQRYITVPFRSGTISGQAVMHRVAEDIDADDPRVHDWSIQSIAFPLTGKT